MGSTGESPGNGTLGMSDQEADHFLDCRYKCKDIQLVSMFQMRKIQVNKTCITISNSIFNRLDYWRKVSIYCKSMQF